MHVFQELVKEIPGWHVVWGFQPDVRGVDAAEGGDACRGKAFPDDAGVFHVVADHFPDLGLAFRGENRLCTTLDDVGGAVELGGVAAVPQGIQCLPGAVSSFAGNGLGQDDVAAAGAGEACCLGEGAELNGTVFGLRNLKDGAWHILLGDVGVVSSIKEDDGVMLQGVVHPLFQLLTGEGGARRIIRAAEVNQVNGLFRQLRAEIVLGVAGKIGDALVAAIRLQSAGAAGHDIGVQVYRVYRIRDGNGVIGAEDFLDVAAVALGTIRHEYLVSLNAQPLVVVFDDFIHQEAVALLRAVAPEGIGGCHFVYCLVHGLDAGLWQWQGYIAYAQGNDVSFRMRLNEGGPPAGCLPEKIAACQL